MLKGGIATVHDDCAEIALRTIAGLVEANQHDLPNLVERMEWAPPESLVPRSVLRVAVKDMQREDALLGGKGKYKRRAGKAGGRGANGNNNDAPPSAEKPTGKKSGGGAGK